MDDAVHDCIGVDCSTQARVPAKFDGWDVSKLADAGWRAKISLEDGLSSTVEWYRANVNDVRV